MPITQSRMIKLLDEYERLVHIHRKLVAEMQMLAAKVEIIDRSLFGNILNATIDSCNAVHHTPRLEIERAHFNSAQRRNDRVRAKMEQKRRALGMRPVDSPEYRENARRHYDSRVGDAVYDRAMGNEPIRPDEKNTRTNSDIFSLTPEEMEKEANEGIVNADEI